MGRLLVLVLLALSLGSTSAQQPWPIKGQGIAPDGVTTVYINVMIDSIQKMSATEGTWNGHVWFHFSWNDTRAAAAIQNATNLWAAQTAGSGFGDAPGCNLPCDYVGHPSAGCCDGVWLPAIELPNLVELNQEAVYKYHVWMEPATINADGSATPSATMHRALRVSAGFHSPYDFRAWPFEHQHLLIEIQPPASTGDRVSLILMDTKSLVNTPHTKGEVLPGWHIVSMTRRMYDTSACYASTESTTSLFNISGNDTTATFRSLAPEDWAQLTVFNSNSVDTDLAASDCAAVPLLPPGLGAITNEAMAQYGPQVVVVDMMIKRNVNYYALSTVTPLALLAYMVFVTYAMERSDLEARMGVVVTLVLAISALQFTWDFPPASYLNCIQQILLMSYVLYFIVAIESMITANIYRLHERRRRYQRLEAIAHTGSMSSSFSSGAFARPASPSDVSNGNGNGIPTTARADHRGSASEVPWAGKKANGEPKLDRITAPLPAARKPPPLVDVTVDVLPSPSPVCEATEESQSTLLQAPLSGEIKPPSLPPSQSGGRTYAMAADGRPIMLLVPDSPAVGTPADASTKASPPPTTAGRHRFGFLRCTGTRNGDVGATSTNGNKSGGYSIARAVSMHFTSAVSKTKALQLRIDKEEAFAQLFASRMDFWFCMSLLVAYTITLSVLLWVNTAIGDHRMMLVGSTPPGNM